MARSVFTTTLFVVVFLCGAAPADPTIITTDGGWRRSDAGMTCLHRGHRYDAEIVRGVGSFFIDGKEVAADRIEYFPAGFSMTVEGWSETITYTAMLDSGRSRPCLRINRSTAPIADERGFEFLDVEENCCEWK